MINILKFQRQLLLNQEIAYVGRGTTLDDLGLGNPFSHKRDRAKWTVCSLEESISEYRKWLYRLLKAYLSRQTKSLLENWEIAYLKQVLKLAKQIKSGEISSLMCWCINFPNYSPDRSKDYKCHAQVLYAAILWLETQSREPKS